MMMEAIPELFAINTLNCSERKRDFLEEKLRHPLKLSLIAAALKTHNSC